MRSRMVDTTVGRVLIGEVLPPDVPFDYVNKVMNKKALSQLIDVCYRKHKNKGTRSCWPTACARPGLQPGHAAGHLHLHGRHGHPGEEEGPHRAGSRRGREA